MAIPGWHLESKHVSGQAYLYRARRKGTDGPFYALKRLKNPKRAARFVREVETMTRLCAAGVAVPPILEADLEDPNPWFAMPWYASGSLEDAVEDTRFRENPIMGLQVLQALAATLSDVHAHKVAHRDLKPANVLMDDSGPALTDFGLCLDIDEDGDGADRLTSTEEAVGSRHYVAPENEGGINANVDQRPSDFYAFGKVVWALLTGRSPLPRERQLESGNLLAHMLDDPRMAPVDALLRDLLIYDPRARLTDWRIVTDELRVVEAILGGRERGVPRTVGADVVRMARRVRMKPELMQQLEAADAGRQTDAWYRDLFSALMRRAKEAGPSLEPLAQALDGLIEIGPTEAPPVADRTAVEGAELSPLSDTALPTETAVGFMIHPDRGLPGLPTILVRIWTISDGKRVWFNRAPTIARVGEPERVPAFLAEPFLRQTGPFPAHRQTTIEQGLDLIDETALLFHSLVEQYLRAVAEDQDPALAETWSDRLIEPVELTLPPVGSDQGADTTPPELEAFTLKSSIDASAEDPTVVVGCRITDDRSGIGDGGSSSPSQARFRSRSGQLRDVLFIPATRVEGDERDGSYSASFRLDGHAERGRWRVEYVLLVDNAGNQTYLDNETLASRGFPTLIYVNDAK